MLTLPSAAEPLVWSFSVAFSEPSFQRAVVLMIGSILAMGRRTVTNMLWTVRVLTDGHFSSYHRESLQGLTPESPQGLTPESPDNLPETVPEPASVMPAMFNRRSIRA